MKEQNNVITKVMNYIEDNLEKDLDLTQIAEHVGYSKFHLNRIFTEEVGCTIYKYLQSKRLCVAAKKLTDTDVSITQIAYDAGYNSQQAFTLAFRQLYNTPPMAYRKRYLVQSNITAIHNYPKYFLFYKMEVNAA